MNYVLDASVAVASLRPAEPLHAASVAYLSPLLAGRDTIVVPSIFRVEVASALARAGFTAAQIGRFVGAFLAGARVATIGPKRAVDIQAVAVDTRLRAADAVYVWLAQKEGLPLVTGDAEVLLRGAGRCQFVSP
jgi:predicted nucleic acid-binding protein